VDPASLRPLGIGEILDTALTIYRARAATLMRAVVIVVAPVQVLSAIVSLSAGGLDTSTTGDSPFVNGSGADATIDGSALLGFVAVVVGVGLLGFLASQLATAACLKSVSSSYLSGDPDWKESLRFALSRLRPLVWLYVLYGLGLVGALLLCIAPGVYLYGAWAVATPVLLVEGTKGSKALRRSRQLVKGRWGPTFLVIVLGAIMSAIVQAAITGVLVGLLASGANDVVQAAGNAIAGTISAVLVTPFSAAVAVVLYFDLRVRKEGFDLELLAQRVGIDPPEGTTFAPSPLPPPRPVVAEGDEQPPFWPPPPGWRPGA
jgi:hypothetical protein